MKKIIIIISVILNIFLIFFIISMRQNMNNEKSEDLNNAKHPIEYNIDNKTSSESSTLSDELSQRIEYYYSDLMDNPIDRAYKTIITDQTSPEIKIRELQVKYKELWEKEYSKALKLLRDKAIYQEDKDNIDKFDDYVRNYYTENKTFFETVVLHDYSDPSLPEKNSYGNGTSDKLIENQGKLYRNACMQIITLLPYGEYHYPENIDFDN